MRIYNFSFIVEKISQLNWISLSGIVLTTFPPDGHLAVADEIKMVRIRAKTFIFEWKRLLDREIYKMGPFVIFSTNFLLIYCQRFFTTRHKSKFRNKWILLRMHRWTFILGKVDTASLTTCREFLIIYFESSFTLVWTSALLYNLEERLKKIRISSLIFSPQVIE